MKLSNLKRVLCLIVTVTLIAGLTAMPIAAECAESTVVSTAPTVNNAGSGSTSVESRDGGIWAVRNTSTSHPRFNIAATNTYTIGMVAAETDPTFVKLEYTIKNCKESAQNLYDASTNLIDTLPASGTVDYMLIVNLQTGKITLYKKTAGVWGAAYNTTVTGSFGTFYSRLTYLGVSDPEDYIIVSDMKETVYTGSWSTGAILGIPTVTYPTPTTRSGSDMQLTGGNGTWTAVMTGGNQGGLSLPLIGSSVDMSASYIKTEATVDPNGATNLFTIPELTINGARDTNVPVTTSYTSYIDLVAIIDVKNQDVYLYTTGMEPFVYSLDPTYSLSILTQLNLAWRKTAATTTGTINISNYKQTTYYDSELTVASVLVDGGVADSEIVKASLYAWNNTNAGEYANVNIAKDSDVWTVTTTGEAGSNSEVKMLSAYYAPKMGYVATENARNYADFIHYSATVKVTGGEYESYKIGATGISAAGNQTTMAPAVYGTNGLPELVEGTEYDVDMIYDVETSHTYVYVNDVLCEDRALSITGLDFTGFSMAFNGVTSPVTVVITEPTFKYYNKSGDWNKTLVTDGLDDNGVKLNYAALSGGAAYAQFYGNLEGKSYVVAVYEDANSLKIALKDELEGIAEEISQPDIEEGDTVKVFLWETDTLNPVIPAITVQ